MNVKLGIWNANFKNDTFCTLLLVSALLWLAHVQKMINYTVGFWYRHSALDGPARTEAASFVINNEGYICCGYKGGSSPTKLKGFMGNIHLLRAAMVIGHNVPICQLKQVTEVQLLVLP